MESRWALAGTNLRRDCTEGRGSGGIGPPCKGGFLCPETFTKGIGNHT